MHCIWATSLELTWGVFALRTVITNVREWVFQRVKPQIVGWISAARRTTEPRFPATASPATTSASHELKYSVPEGLDMSSPTSRKSVKVDTMLSGHKNAAKDQVHSKGSATMEDEESTDEGYNSGHKHQSSPLRQYTHGINCPCPQLACWLSDDEEEDDDEDDDDEEEDDEDDDEDDEEEDEDEDDEDNEEDDEDLYELLGSLSLSGGRWRR
jgi:DNA mismatch repair ATPase MutL